MKYKKNKPYNNYKHYRGRGGATGEGNMTVNLQDSDNTNNNECFRKSSPPSPSSLPTTTISSVVPSPSVSDPHPDSPPSLPTTTTSSVVSSPGSDDEDEGEGNITVYFQEPDNTNNNEFFRKSSPPTLPPTLQRTHPPTLQPNSKAQTTTITSNTNINDNT